MEDNKGISDILSLLETITCIKPKKYLKVRLSIEYPKSVRNSTLSVIEIDGEKIISLKYYDSSPINISESLNKIPSTTLEIIDYSFCNWHESSLYTNIAKLLKNFKTYIGIITPSIAFMLTEMSNYSLKEIIITRPNLWIYPPKHISVCFIYKLDLSRIIDHNYYGIPALYISCRHLKILLLNKNICDFRYTYNNLDKYLIDSSCKWCFNNEDTFMTPCFDWMINSIGDTLKIKKDRVNVIISEEPLSFILDINRKSTVQYCSIVEKYQNIQIILRYDKNCQECNKYEYLDKNGEINEAQSHIL